MRRIGGSDIPKLLGVSKYGNAMDVYQRIVLELEEEWNPRMERGAAMEPVLRAHAQRVLGVELEETESDVHSHPGVDFAWAQVDDLARWQGIPVAVDYKSQTVWRKGWGAPETDEVPEDIRAQVAWELACTDREVGLLVVGFGEDVDGPEIFNLHTVQPYVVQREPVFESYCLQVAREFWTRHVLPRVPPEVQPIGKKKRKAS